MAAEGRCSLADSALGYSGGDVRALAPLPGHSGLFLAASERPMQLGGSLGEAGLQEASRKACPEDGAGAGGTGSPVDLRGCTGADAAAHGALHALMNLTATADAARRQRGAEHARLALFRAGAGEAGSLRLEATVTLPDLAVPDHVAVSVRSMRDG